MIILLLLKRRYAKKSGYKLKLVEERMSMKNIECQIKIERIITPHNDSFYF